MPILILLLTSQHPPDYKRPGLATPVPCHQFYHLKQLLTLEIHATCSKHNLYFLAAHLRYDLYQMYNMQHISLQWFVELNILVSYKIISNIFFPNYMLNFECELSQEVNPLSLSSTQLCLYGQMYKWHMVGQYYELFYHEKVPPKFKRLYNSNKSPFYEWFILLSLIYPFGVKFNRVPHIPYEEFNIYHLISSNVEHLPNITSRYKKYIGINYSITVLYFWVGLVDSTII